MNIHKLSLLIALVVWCQVASAQTVISTIEVSDFHSATSLTSGACAGQISTDGKELTLLDNQGFPCVSSAKFKEAVICAKEYVVSIELNVSDPGGEGRFYLGTGLVNPTSDEHYRLDTFGISTVSEGRRDEVERIEMYEKGQDVSNVLQLGANPECPFETRGQGWTTLTLHVSDGDVIGRIEADLNAGGLRTQRYAAQGRKVFPYIISADNFPGTYKVRNLKVNILRSDNCSGQAELRVADVNSLITDSCGGEYSCPFDQASFLECAQQEISLAEATGRVRPETTKLCNDEVARRILYCDGFTAGEEGVSCNEEQKSAYANGYTAGVASIDLDVLLAEGFSKGVASVDVTAVKSKSFAEGVQSVDTVTIRQAGYNDGFTAGKDSITCEAPEPKPEPSKKGYICHKGKTIKVATSAFAGHLGHGDYKGKCKKNGNDDSDHKDSDDDIEKSEAQCSRSTLTKRNRFEIFLSRNLDRKSKSKTQKGQERYEKKIESLEKKLKELNKQCN